MKMKKNKILIISLSLLSYTFYAEASPRPQQQFAYNSCGSAPYICFNEIIATGLTANAKRPFDMTKNSYDAFWTVVNTTQELTSAQLNSALVTNMEKISISYANIKEAEYHRRLQIKMEMDDVAQEFKVQKDIINTELINSPFPQVAQVVNAQPRPVRTDSPEFLFYKAKCDSEKIASSVGVSAREVKNYSVNTELSAEVATIVNTASSRALLVNKQRNILENYCNEVEFNANQCKEKSAMPYAHTLATAFLTPSGNTAENNSSTYKTRFTYNNLESEIARDYLRTVIQPMAVDAPRGADFNIPSKSEYINLYTSYLTALNLANYSFTVARQNRMPIQTINDEGSSITVSYFDTLNYLIYNMGKPESLVAIRGAGGNSAQIKLYEAMTLNSKLQMEIYMQKKRENLIDAAILAIMQNRAREIIYLNNIK